MRYISLISLGIMLIFSSCSEFLKVQKSPDSDMQYEYAKGLYEKKEYTRALMLFDAVFPFYRGKEKAEDLTYYMAYSYYYQNDFYMAAYYFKNYVRLFPTGKQAEECTYMSAICKSLDAPNYKLDQASTREALVELQLFINYYPNSPRVDEANKKIDEMREKMAMKSFYIAKQYYRRRIYLSAIISFENMMKDYPESSLREEAMFLTLKSRYLYAKNSVHTRQLERYQAAKDAYDQFERDFPNSVFMKEAGQLNAIITSKI